MIFNSLVLATLTTTAGFFIYKNLPKRLKDLINAHPLATRIICALGVYALFGASVTALFAAAFLDIIISILLELGKDPAAVEAGKRLGALISATRQQMTHALAETLKKAVPERSYLPEYRQPDRATT